MTARKERREGLGRRERLERQMQRALSELPACQAPASLERRVVEAIEHGATHAAQAHAANAKTARAVSVPGKSSRRGSFKSWPLVARAALIASCLASAIVVILGLKELAIGLATLPAAASIAGRLHTLREAADAIAALGAVLARLVRMIPPAWLLSGILAAAFVYAVLFALVAIGYSMLYTIPERSRS